MTIRCHMPTCSFTQNFWGKTFLERTTVPRPGTEYTDNYLLSSGFWPRVKLKNYHHPVRPLSFKRFQLLIVRAQSMDKRDCESKNSEIN